MKYKSAIMTSASGSVGGLTASHNRGGNYFRSRVVPSDPGTCRQATMRAGFSAIANVWSDQLSPAERTSWEEYAQNVPHVPAFCGPMQLSGQNVFMASNTPRYQADLPLVTTAPTSFTSGVPTGTPTEFSYEPGTDNTTLNFDPQADWSDDGDALIYIGRPQNISRTSYHGPYQLAGIVPVVGDTSSPIQLSATGAQLLSDYSIGLDTQNSIRTRVVYDDGRVSTSVSCMSAPSEESPP